MVGSTKLSTPISAPVHRQIDWGEVCWAVLNQYQSYLSHGPTLRTLGLPLYLAQSESEYLKAATVNNASLWSRFGWLLEAMVETLESVVRAPITYDPRLALPGFHIFKSSDQVPYNGGVWHVDIFRYEVIPPPLASFSATLLLGDTQTTYGIDYTTDKATEHFQHRIGEVTVFSSNLQHRVAPVSPGPSPKARVTLQAQVWAYPQHAIAFW